MDSSILEQVTLKLSGISLYKTKQVLGLYETNLDNTELVWNCLKQIQMVLGLYGTLVDEIRLAMDYLGSILIKLNQAETVCDLIN